MFLKSLEIRGFKSFADKTELKFKKGVTAVVGPNGSGKSNISDAVRWVLGEQSIKVLRGGKMEDVIFAGTQFRKPVGLAQVSLTLDNSDGSLATDYSEVTVSRRIFRSGESEYLINNNKCRLKDISQLFMDTGIGKEGYSLIGQGKIEAILSGKPEDRRALIEEAAGIVKFKNRKEEAEKKLNNTDENLIRIKDIMSTYEERIEPLRIEREKAICFNELSNGLKKKEVSLIVHTIKGMEEELSAVNDQLNRSVEDLNLKKADAAKDKAELKKIEADIEELDRRTFEEKEAFYDLKENVSEDTKNIELFNERIKAFREKIKRNNEEVSDLKSKIVYIKNNKEMLLKDIAEKQEETIKKNEEIEKLKKENQVFSKSTLSKENELQSLRKEEINILKKNADIQNEIAVLNKEITLKNEQIEQLKSAGGLIQSNILINSKTFKGLEEEIENKKMEIEKYYKEIENEKRELSRFNNILLKKENEYKEASRILTKLEANRNMLENLERHYEGYNRSVKTLMESINNDKISHAHDTKVVGEIFKVEAKYETAIEIALGASISNVITKDEMVAKKLINHLKANHLGRATFLPLNIIRGKKLILNDNITKINGYIGIASEIVQFDAIYENIIDYILGRTIICTDMDTALNIAKKGSYTYRIVTLDGEVINSGGALTGGSVKGKNTNVLGRKREIEELGEEILNKTNACKELLNECSELKSKIKNLDEEILNKRDAVHEKSIDLARKNEEKKNLQNDSERLKNNLAVNSQELDKAVSNKALLEKQIINNALKVKDIEKHNNLTKNKIIELENYLKEKQELIDGISEKLTAMKIEKAALDEGLQGKKNEFHRIEKEVEQFSYKEQMLIKENEESHADIEKLTKQIDEKEKNVSDNNNKIIYLENKFKEEEIIKEKLKAQFKEKDNYISTVMDDISNKEMEVNKIEVLKAKKEAENEHIYNKLNEELQLTYAEAIEISEPVENIKELKEEIAVTKSKIRNLGTVNLGSIEEYEEVKEKYEFMSSQAEDLERAKDELISVINEMTEEMKIVFKENFAILNYNFNKTFRNLFKGGSAELILGKGDELEANIDINVEPPGKKLQNINLMSGGEKVLSAIALLFAILEMKPTPFCILDEIEAALDDANVYRYAEFLTRFSEKTQFIVITHRKGTMEASDIIYGVTMEEKGISKVVSVDLTENSN